MIKEKIVTYVGSVDYVDACIEEWFQWYENNTDEFINMLVTPINKPDGPSDLHATIIYREKEY